MFGNSNSLLFSTFYLLLKIYFTSTFLHIFLNKTLDKCKKICGEALKYINFLGGFAYAKMLETT